MKNLKQKDLKLLVDLTLIPKNVKLRDREIFHKVYIEGIKQSDVAKDLGLSEPLISRVCNICKDLIVDDDCLVEKIKQMEVS